MTQHKWYRTTFKEVNKDDEQVRWNFLPSDSARADIIRLYSLLAADVEWYTIEDTEGPGK